RLRQRGFTIGPQKTIDALLAIEAVGLAHEADVKAALRLVLCASPEEQQLFDEMYPMIRNGVVPSEGQQQQFSFKTTQQGHQQSADEEDQGEQLSSYSGFGAEARAASAEETLTERIRNAISASFLQRKTVARVRIPEDGLKEMIAAARILVAGSKRRDLRRFAAARKGTVLDFRRTIRRSMHTGGEIVRLAPKAPRMRRTKFVLLCDGSRSMAGFAERFLQFAYAMTCCSRKVEVFLFSTELKWVTKALYATKRSRLAELTLRGAEWGGGTRIGEALEAFLQQHGRRILGKGTLFLMASDGLETGSVDLLRHAMQAIKRNCAGVIWLNPLLGISGYEPTARGMQAVLPFLDTFSHATVPEDFKALAYTVINRG
ncbi:MAG: vWA domain-containing protein, partial [Clostridia bacterium]